jgi:hypothetical protein
MMRCDEINLRLLEFVDGGMSAEEGAAVREHLAGCPMCRAEAEQLQAGARAVRAAVQHLAPAQHYLTPQRMERLMAAHRSSRRPFKIITMHRLVAAAAVAAIVAAAPFLVGDVARILNPPPEEQPGLVAEAPIPEWHGPAILAATGRGAPMSLMRSVSATAQAPAEPGSPEGRMSLVISDTPGLRVPVESVLYEPEESSHWW